MRIYGEAKERDLKETAIFRSEVLALSGRAKCFLEYFRRLGQWIHLDRSRRPAQLLGENVTANYFDLLGIQPIIGRNFLQEEEMRDDVGLVTENFWRKRLDSDPGVIGRSIALNGVATTIVGVLPNLPISWFGRDTEVFMVKPFELPEQRKIG